MSKEIQCKCCKYYWWETDIHSKSGLCPNCYDYFANLEAKLAEKMKQGAKDIVMQLKQQLKDTEESYNNTMRYLNKTRSELLNLPKKIVGEIRDVLNGNDVEIQDNIYLTDILDTILKKYGGENESK